jgi:phage baseplate assembly protein W
MSNGSSQGQDFLGAGIAFPLAVDAQGRIAMNSLEGQVRQSILLIMQTAKGERVMRPDFGAGLQSFLFEPLTPATAAAVQHQVKEALVRFEPRIEVLKVDVLLDPKQISTPATPGMTINPDQAGVLFIQVQYRVRVTDTTFNLVYPFYIERGGI